MLAGLARRLSRRHTVRRSAYHADSADRLPARRPSNRREQARAREHRFEDEAAVLAREFIVGRPFGMGHQPEDVAALVAYPSDGRHRAVRVGGVSLLAVRLAVAQDHLAILL